MANLIGQTLLQQFIVESFIASGGMGAVYRVWDLKRNVRLAMKVLHSELADDPSIFKRFRREANALKKLIHPHIVPFYGLYQALDFAFILELFIDGPSLKEIIKQHNKEPLPIEEAMVYVKALCAALGYAHAHGVIHCDVKPGNVMIDQGGNIFLTDFGVARHADSTTTTLGEAGTPAYMPPEQILGGSVTPASDIYSLGVMLFEMLTGRRPFHGQETGTEKGGSTLRERIRYAHLHTPPPDPRTINPSISQSLSKVILKSLSKDSPKRFRTTGEFFAAICEASGLSPEEIGNRAGISTYSVESKQLTHEIPTSRKQPMTVVKKVRSLSSGQITVLLALAIIFSALVAMGMPQFPGPWSPTITSTATKTSTATITPSPLPSPTQTPEPAAVFNWTKYVVDSGADEPGPFLSMEIGENGKYYLAYFLDRIDKLKIVEGDGASWEPLSNLRQLNGEGIHVGIYISLDLDSTDSPYLSYLISDKNMGRGVYLVSDGTWSTATIDRNLDIFDMRVILDSKGIPHYVVLAKNGDITYRTSETSPTRVKAGALPPNPSVVNFHKYFPIALDVGPSQNPYICFSKTNRLQCIYTLGNSWQHINVAENGIYPSLQIDNADNLHLAYYDYKEKSLKYAFLMSGSSRWTIDTVDTDGDVGWYPSLKVDKNKLVHVSYYDADNTSLKYAIGQMGRWSIETIDDDGNVGLTSSLVIDSQNNPGIAYYDLDKKCINLIVGYLK